MKSPLLFSSFVLVGVACGSSGTPSSQSSSGSGMSSTSGSTSGSMSGSGSTSPPGDDAGGGATAEAGSGSSSGSPGIEAGGGGDDSTAPEAGGTGDDAGGGGVAEGGTTAPAGDGGVCSGTVYGAGNQCPGNMPPAAGNTMPCTTTVQSHGATPSMCANCTTCPPDGMACCPAQAGSTTGYTVGQLLLGMKDNVTFYNVMAPADGDYNIVWYYHCGNADTDGYKSATCPSSPEGSSMGPPGCREALFTVNGVTDPMTYEMPCFLNGPNTWAIVHSWQRDDPATKALIPFHLKAGANTIKIFADAHDTVDLSSIRVPDGM
jgi:hypothetical protein